jgi:hypothetical protein
MSTYIKAKLDNAESSKDASSAARGFEPSPYARYRALAGLMD